MAEVIAPIGDGEKDVSKLNLAEMTSKDYYFDSYAHFGIHEVSFIHFFVQLVYFVIK